MTVLCAVRDGKTVALAADSQTSTGNLVMNLGEKIWRTTTGGADWLLAGTGKVRIAQVVRYQFSPPHGDETDLMRYLVTTFVPALRTVLAGANVEYKLNEVTSTDAAFIAARHGRIFSISHDYCVVEHSADRWASGSGMELALGAMHASSAKTPADIAHAGVAAAIEYDLHCAGPIQVETL